MHWKGGSGNSTGIFLQTVRKMKNHVIFDIHANIQNRRLSNTSQKC